MISFPFLDIMYLVFNILMIYKIEKVFQNG